MRFTELKGIAKEFFGRSHAVEGFVGCLDFGFFRFAEPASFAMKEFVFQLGIELVVLNGRSTVDGTAYFHADKPAAAAAVGQQVAAVAGTDKAGDARQGFAVRYPAGQRGHTVYPIPLRQLLHISGKRMEDGIFSRRFIG